MFVWKIQIFDMDKNKILIVESLVRKIYQLPLYLPVFLKFPVFLCVYVYIWRKGACIFALHKLKVGFTQALRKT